MKDVVAIGLFAPEGPALLPSGELIFTQQLAGEISLLSEQGVRPLARVSGAANSVAPGADGYLYVCQNSGIVGPWRSEVRAAPGIQVIAPDGRSETITSVGGYDLFTPNDLAFAPDGTLAFTDPAQPFDADRPSGDSYVYRIGPDWTTGGQVHRYTPGQVYTNGIAFDPQGRLHWVESYTRRVMRLEEDGRMTRLAVLPPGHVPDGLAIAVDGRIFIATCASHGIDVLSPTGEYLKMIYLDDTAYPSNLCFRGAELWVTDFGMDWLDRHDSGRLWRIKTDATGIPPTYGSVPTRQKGDPDGDH